MKKISFFIFSALLFLSCSDKDYDSLIDEIESENPDNNIQLLPLRLVADIDHQNIYEMIVFKVQDSTYKGSNESMALPLTYADVIDSLVWEVEGSAKKMDLLEKNNGDFKLTLEWGHYFYLPGDYKTFLRGYKGKDIVSQDSAVIKVIAEGDFLNVYWNQLDENLNKNIRYTNNGTKDYSFQILTSLREGVLSSKLNVVFDLLDYTKYNTEIGNEELEILSFYITELYGSTKHDHTDKAIYEEFKRLFQTSIQRDQVVKIWTSQKSNIALIKNSYWEEQGFGYEIHAEPNHSD